MARMGGCQWRALEIALVQLGLTLALPALSSAQAWHPVRVKRDANDRVHFVEVWNNTTQSYEPRVLIGFGNFWLGTAPGPLNGQTDPLSNLLRAMRDEGVNFVRMWLRPSYCEFAFNRSSQQPSKVDLDSFRNEFFDRVDQILTIADSFGIVVEVMMWDTSTGWWPDALPDCQDWGTGHYANVHRPSNSTATSHWPTGLPDIVSFPNKISFMEWYFTDTLPNANPNWWFHQTNYMARLMQTIMQHNNVTVEIINEANGESAAATEQIIRWRTRMHQWLHQTYGADLLIQSEAAQGVGDNEIRALGPSGGVDMVSSHMGWSYDLAHDMHTAYPGVLAGCNECLILPFTPDSVRRFMWGLTMAGGVSYNEFPLFEDVTLPERAAAAEATKAIRAFFAPPNTSETGYSHTNRKPAFWRMESARGRVAPQATPSDKYVLSTSIDGHEAAGQETLVYLDPAVPANSVFRILNNAQNWPYRYRWFTAASQSWGLWAHSDPRRRQNNWWRFEASGGNRGLYVVVTPTAGDTHNAPLAGSGYADLQLRSTSGAIRIAPSVSSTFFPPVPYLPGTNLDPALYDVYRGDVNGDTLTDLVSRQKSNGEVQVYLSNGGAFVAAGMWYPDWPYDTYLADVNGDGKEDLIGRHLTAGTVVVALSNGSSQFTPTRGAWSTGWPAGIELQFADVDDDGKADLVARNPFNMTVAVLKSTGHGFQFLASVSNGFFSSDAMLLTGDVNGDGMADLVAYQVSTRQPFVMVSTGTDFVFYGGQPWINNLPPYPLLPKQVLLRDYTGDGKADLLVRAGTATDDGLFVAISTGSSFSAATTWGGVLPSEEVR